MALLNHAPFLGGGGEFFFEKYVCCDLMSQIRMVGDGAHHKLGTISLFLSHKSALFFFFRKYGFC